jgi:hypothetical protein
MTTTTETQEIYWASLDVGTVYGTEVALRDAIETANPVKRGWSGEWRDYLHGVGLQYVRQGLDGRYVKNGRLSTARFPVGPVIRRVTSRADARWARQAMAERDTELVVHAWNQR